jgi:poly(hydroxyalkanoate) depolymerase family esterase
MKYAVAAALISLGLLVPRPAHGASVVKVDRATWGASGVPSYVNMYIYVPDTLATKPPVVFAHHSCGTPVSGYVGSITGIQAAADKNGFILVLPEATGQNCWDVGSTKSLTHDGGGDTQAVAQMAKYVITKYSADAARVYAMGGSSGAMMTQALMAVYPDIFKAGSARAGVPAGCWADGYASSNQWSNNCANGQTTKTAQQWGDLVRAMYPGYTGPRRRIQLFQGTADQTISYNNMGESIKEWTNVLGLSVTPASTDTFKTSMYTYARQFWKSSCGFTVFETWAGQNGSHSMPYEQDAILAFFGLDKAGGVDPEVAACSGDGGVGGSGGSSGAGGAGGATGAGGARDGGVDGGSDGGMAGVGGVQGRGGSSGRGGSGGVGGAAGTGGTVGTGGSSAPGTGGSSGSSGAAGTGGTVASGSGGSAAAGTSGGAGPDGTQGSAGSAGGSTPQGGNSGTGGSTPPGGGTDPKGCSCVVGDAQRSGSTAAALLLAAFGLTVRRQRRSRR